MGIELENATCYVLTKSLTFTEIQQLELRVACIE